MSLTERRRRFEAASRADPLVGPKTKFHRLFGVSNSAKVIPGGLQLGVVNLDNVAPDVDGFAFACTIVFPPADEVYFTAYVRSGTQAMIARLGEMKQRAGTADDSASAERGTPEPADDECGRGERREIEAARVKAPAHGQGGDQPVVAAARRGRLVVLPPAQRHHRVAKHQEADTSEQGDVKEADDGIDLTARLRQAEQKGADQAADQAAGDHHQPHPEVDAAALHVGEHARHAGACDLGSGGGDGDAWRNAVEDQQGRGEKAAADPEQAGQDADQPAQRHDEQCIDAHVRDGKVDVHEGCRRR